MNKYGIYDDLEFASFSMLTKPPISTIYIGPPNNGRSVSVGVDKKFNWLQKKMIKWCFGFEVKEN